LPTVTVELWRSDAVVLFDWLTNVDLNTVPITHPSQKQALADLLSTNRYSSGGLMKYVSLNDTIGDIGGVINPNVYLQKLPSFASGLPAGARQFATDPEHYEFHSKRCVKDLKLDQLRFGDDGTWLEILFRHNCWKHEDDLTIRYEKVASVTTDLALSSPPAAQRDVVLDEILPHESGCSHEIACWGGTVRITAQDLTATWAQARCPEKQAAP
jgi:hypothetical protein